MSNILFKSLTRVTKIADVTSASPLASNFYFFIQSHLFSSSSSSLSLKSVKSCLNQDSFTINYLIKSCNLTSKRAISASKHVNFRLADEPNSVLTFFKDQGFTQTQISKVVNGCPSVLLSDSKKTLLPKIEFLKSKGITGSDVAAIISKWPMILSRSIEHRLIPSFNFFIDLLLSDEKNSITALNRGVGVLLFNLEKHGAENIEMLREVGVPLKHISYLLANHSKVLMTSCDKFRHTLDEVKKMDFDPSKITFVMAVHVLRSVSKSKWDRTLEIYKKWGWSEKEIDAAFRYHPKIMTISEDKITSSMEFWVDKMGWEPSFLANMPTIVFLSLEKRVVPRCEVYTALLSKGVKKPCGLSLSTFLVMNDKKFLEKLIERHGEEASELLKIYKEKMGEKA